MSQGAPIHASSKGPHTVLSFVGRVLTIRSTSLRANAVPRTRGGYPVSGRRVSAIQRQARTSSVRPARTASGQHGVSVSGVRPARVVESGSVTWDHSIRKPG